MDKELVLGVGLNDLTSSWKNGTPKDYHCWFNMLDRCYGARSLEEFRPSYQGCSVTEEWLTFSIFKAWYDANFVEGWELDKDILVAGNKVYSPHTCVFVPHNVNSLLLTCDRSRGKLPLGINLTQQGRYWVRCSTSSGRKSLGAYSDLQEAWDAYCAFKLPYAEGLLESAPLSAYLKQRVLLTLKHKLAQEATAFELQVGYNF